MTSQDATSQSEAGKLILVVEDDHLIAADVAAMLREGGFRVLGPVSTVAAGVQLATQHQPDAAVLDVALRNDLVTPLAQTLEAAGVPFVITSAYSPVALQPYEVLARAPQLAKPTQPSELIDTLRRLVA